MYGVGNLSIEIRLAVQGSLTTHVKMCSGRSLSVMIDFVVSAKSRVAS